MNNRRTFSLILCVIPCVFALAALLSLVADPTHARSSTRYVSDAGSDSGNDCTDPNNPCLTVQHAVDRANSDDVIKVATGVYTDLNSLGGQSQVVYITRTTIIKGGYVAPGFTDPPDPDAHPTTMDAQGQGRVILIRGSGDISPTLQGLRLTNGSIGDLGGAIYAYRAHLTISDCQIYSNTASNGGGVLLWRSDGARLAGNTVYSNTASGNGGGLFFWDSDATVINNMVTDNMVDGLGSTGAGINVYSSTIQLLHATLARNRGGAGHGLYVVGSSTVTAANAILVSHTVGINVGGGSKPSTATLTATLWGTGTWANESDWLGGGTITVGTRNYWAEPGFTGPDAGDYHIGPGSAAVNRGIDAGVVKDIDGDPRPDWCFFDIGADELSTGLSCRHLYLPLLRRSTP